MKSYQDKQKEIPYQPHFSEKDIQTLSSRHGAILAAIPDIIMEVDANKVYTWANQAGLELGDRQGSGVLF